MMDLPEIVLGMIDSFLVHVLRDLERHGPYPGPSAFSRIVHVWKTASGIEPGAVRKNDCDPDSTSIGECPICHRNGKLYSVRIQLMSYSLYGIMYPLHYCETCIPEAEKIKSEIVRQYAVITLQE